VGGKLVKNLRLSGDTITKIFTNKITNWNDAAITKDNNGRKLPSIPIIPVVRSDGSGTTAQFTRWMDTEYGSDWKAFNGKSGLTSYYPKKGKAVGQSGSDQVMNFIASSAGNGTIGYVEYSYAVNKHYPVVKVLNKGGYYVEPTQYNVAVALTQAKINQDKNSDLYLTQVLDGVYNASDSRAYPLSSYSYLLLPTGKDGKAPPADKRMSTKKRQTLADFMF
jgi:phosphate transport system substrate-binding protein